MADLLTDLAQRLEATLALEKSAAELPRRRLKRGHQADGRLGLGADEHSIFGESELVLVSPATRVLSKGVAVDPKHSRAEIAEALTSCSKGQFGVRVYPDGSLDLVPDRSSDAIRVLEIAWRMAGHPGDPNPTPRLCAQCYKPLTPRRSSMRFCSARCRSRAAYVLKKEGRR